ncbi:MAG TPA: glycosyltransferase family 4 protein [Clostridiales bacterium]|jgi:glycosyltransferase involved in cell wall biosynthesis|nr:glycosyltransferase family 4 protein [Clostridiales bacterium]
MKVLIVASYNSGKFSPFVLEQVDALKEQNVSFDFFGIQGKGVRGYLRCRQELLTKIGEFRPDIIHAHYGLSGLLANLQRKVPVVTTYHGSDIHSGGMLLKLSKMSMRLSKYNIFVSSKLLEMANYRKGNATVQACGVDFDKFIVLPKEEARKQLDWGLDEKCVLFAGAFDNVIKNSELAKEACELIPECKLIELKGYSREEVNLLMNACDCLFMTSHREASPMVIKEAMLCGTPVVSVDVGDVKEVIGNTNGCFIVNRDPKEIANRLSDAIKFSIEKGKTNGRERIMELGLDNRQVAEKIVNIYKKILKC